MDKFIFDVDGTLTPSRGKIDTAFKEYFNNFCRNNQVFLVTGSDKPKTVEQLGEDTYNLAHTVYNCSGNDVWQGSTHVRQSEWTLPESAHMFLSECLTESAFPLRTGLHFEHRPGMVNFSVVGRNATLGERKLYVKFDTEVDERNTIAKHFNKMFPEIEARPGGETGIDIAPKGSDKSQILIDFDKTDRIIFFGDRMDVDGNDHPLMIANQQGLNYPVKGWEDTWNKLNAYISNGS
jgi:phosphomannomutase